MALVKVCLARRIGDRPLLFQIQKRLEPIIKLQKILVGITPLDFFTQFIEQGGFLAQRCMVDKQSILPIDLVVCLCLIFNRLLGSGKAQVCQPYPLQ